jgi:NADH-quinone oxidoreductase subunit N
LVITAVVFAAISVYYYFKVIQAMYFKTSVDSTAQTLSLTAGFRLGLLLAAILIILLGVFPYQLLLNTLTVY